jgi:hypothetical protein
VQKKLVLVNFTLEKLESEVDTAQVHRPQQQAEEDAEQAQILQHKIYITEMQRKNQEDGGGGVRRRRREVTAGSSSQPNLKTLPPPSLLSPITSFHVQGGTRQCFIFGAN